MKNSSSNYIIEYFKAIKSGEVVVSKKVKKVYKKLVKDLNKPRYPWVFNINKANHTIEFIEKYCRHSKGSNDFFILELWQKSFVSALFGFVHQDTNLRRFTKGILFVARKNGKSTFASAIMLYLMVADGEAGPEIYSVATKRDQAKIIWKDSKKMVNKSPALKSKLKCLVGEIVGEFNDSTYVPLSSDHGTLDGLNIHGAVMDEIHAWQGTELHAVIADSVTARKQPVLLETSTAGMVREGAFDLEYEMAKNNIDDIEGFEDDRTLCVIYELDKRSEWVDEKCWAKANPGLGTIKDIEKLRDKVKKAQANPLLQKNLLCKDFNIPETSTYAWLTYDQIYNDAKFDINKLKPKYGIGGTDLSSTTDLTASKVIFMLPNDPKIYVISMYWLPEELLEKRTIEDKIPYDKWHEMGLLRTTEGNKVHPKYVTSWFVEIQNDYDIYLPWIGYDAWSATYWVEEMKGYFGKEAMIPVHQGKKTLSSPMKSLEADLEAKRIIYNDNPIDKWCLTNTAIETDKNLNIQPAKLNNRRKRIDGTSALLDAYVVLGEKMNDYQNMI